MRRTDPLIAAQRFQQAEFLLDNLTLFRGKKDPTSVLHVPCQRRVEVKLSNIERGFTDCPLCTDDARVEKMRSKGVEPLVPYTGARDPWPCQCRTCGSIVEPTYDNMRNQGACRYCVGQGPVTQERAVKEMLADGAEPQEPYPGDVHAAWKCCCLTCRRDIEPSRANARRQNPCKYCSKEAAGEKIRVSTAEEAEELLTDNGLASREPYPGLITVGWAVTCLTCVWTGTVQLHYLRQGNRPRCICRPKSGGFDGTKPGYLYVLAHRAADAGKFGIHNAGTPRLDHMAYLGFTVYRTRYFEVGFDAQAAERTIKAGLRSKGWSHFLTRESMGPYGGHTETFDLERFSAAEVWSMAQGV